MFVKQKNIDSTFCFCYHSIMTLKQYLRQNKIKAGTFAGSIGIDRQLLYYYLDGKTPGLENIMKIKAATNNDVDYEDWLSEKMKRHIAKVVPMYQDSIR